VLTKNILLKNYFHLEDDNNYVGGLCIKIHFFMFIKMLDEIKEKMPPKYTKIYPPKKQFLLDVAPLVVCFHPKSTCDVNCH